MAKKSKAVVGAALKGLGQLGMKHDARGGMEGSYTSKKPPRSGLSLYAAHGADGQRVVNKKTGIHSHENLVKTKKHKMPVDPGSAVPVKLARKHLTALDRAHIREHGDVSLVRKDELKAQGLTYSPPKSAVPGTAHHALQRGKKGGTFYMSNGRKIYSKKTPKAK